MAKSSGVEKAVAKLIASAVTGLIRLFQSDRRPASGRARSLDAADEDWGFSFEVVGEASYQSALRKIAGPGSVRSYFDATLQPEPSNAHDANAVRVEIQGKLVGYLPRSKAAKYKRVYRDSAQFCRCVVVGGGKSKSLGVWLDFEL